MRFGDVITAVVSYFLIAGFLELLVGQAMQAALGVSQGTVVLGLIAPLVAALIVGYIFGARIREEVKMETITKITVLTALLEAFSIGIGVAGSSDWVIVAKDYYLAANPGANLSAYEWVLAVNEYTRNMLMINVAIVLVLGFIGLYIGSMLRKLKKS